MNFIPNHQIIAVMQANPMKNNAKRTSKGAKNAQEKDDADLDGESGSME